MITPETLTRHELVGLPVRVADAANPDLVGTSGRVVDETARTLRVSDGSRTRAVPKANSTLEFRLAEEDITSLNGFEAVVRDTEADDRGGSSGESTYSAGCHRSVEHTETTEVAGRGGPATTESDGRDGPSDTTYSLGREGPSESTYEAASDREVAGDAFEREEDTAGVRPGQSSSTREDARSARKPADGACEGASYVTVDGTKLLSRPALRTEVAAGDTIWQSD
jgi:ribonuclease P protein subunit POP4